MKIADIKSFISTDSKCHVSLIDGSSKDGFIDLRLVGVEEDGRSFSRQMVTVKGDRGRPSIVHPKNIDTITWHPAPVQEVEPVRKYPTRPAPQEAHSGRIAAGIVTRRCATCGKSGVLLTARQDTSGQRVLLCKEHDTKNAVLVPPADKALVAQVTYLLDQASKSDLVEVITRATTRLASAK